jgi:diguanylate cyclase (GGDEF)-like protein
MDLPLVWVGRRESGRSALEIMAAGPAAEYMASLQLSNDEREEGGCGPAGIVLRQGTARLTPVDAPEFAPWREAARRYGFGAIIVAASNTADGGQLELAAYSRDGGPALGDELLDWAQRLVDELARFWDDQALLDRDLRLSRYRDAQRAIQRALLEQPDPEAVCRTLAHALVGVAGAAAVDVFVVDGERLRRVALVGTMAEAMGVLPDPPLHCDGPSIPAPTLCFMQGTPIIRSHPAAHPEVVSAWRTAPLAQMGAIGCWPVFSSLPGAFASTRVPAAVFVVVTAEADAFDAEMCRLLDEIADAAGLALRQHSDRRALLEEQARQTHLALHDALTNLPNRRALDKHLEGALARAQRHQRMVAVGMLDLDDLKPINDRYGHAGGDRILMQVAARLRDALRSDDYVARLGGDEFVLVLEDLESTEDLDVLLARVWQGLRQPLLVDEAKLQISASLGVALFPIHAQANGEQLLRRADQAMYLVKAQKRHRARWWSLPSSPGDAAGTADAHGGYEHPPYGEAAAELLRPWSRALESQLPSLVEGYYVDLLTHEGAANLLRALTVDDVAAVKRRLSWHLRLLLSPDLDADTHHARALQSGFFYAACGLEEVWLLEGVERLRDLFSVVLASDAHRDLRPLNIVLQRIALERQWQLESMRKLQRQRVALLARLNALAWSAEGYLELIQGVVDILASHDEIMACAVGRPETSGRFTYEAVAGKPFTDYLRAMELGETAPVGVKAEDPEGGGPSGRAWRTATIQRCAHFGSDPAMLGWRELALRLGVVSATAIPLCPLPRTPAVVLSLYSRYAGGFQSEDQQAFVEQIKAVLDLALARIAPPRPGTELLPFFVRERWRAMVATAAVEMHYQPVVRLADGRVAELEALARLRDLDGSLLPPGRFLPALSEDDLIVLFREGLLQAAACRQTLEQAGCKLDVSVNASAGALTDPRYAGVVAAVLATSDCPPGALLLEILESPIGTEHSTPAGESGMQALKALGVRLVEDDLGAGYSSLIRLRQWPFDRVKIDQTIVLQVADEALRTLRFIRQLVRLGHDLGLEVVVEGLETPGLIEAAQILGADLGQGYALARPMPATALRGWLAGFDSKWDVAQPLTALGTLAATLLWEERFDALPGDPVFWRRHAETSDAPSAYLHHGNFASAVLIESHARMHAASIGGPRDPVYRQAREAYIAQLIECVKAEERRDGRILPDAA